MTELTSWVPAVVTLVGVGAGWGAFRQTLKNQKEDIAEIKRLLLGNNGMPNYVTRSEWKETWDKFLKRCNERHKGL